MNEWMNDYYIIIISLWKWQRDGKNIPVLLSSKKCNRLKYVQTGECINPVLQKDSLPYYTGQSWVHLNNKVADSEGNPLPTSHILLA